MSSEEERVIRELTIEEIIRKKDFPRCSNCRRYTFLHENGLGSNCKMEVLQEDDVERYEAHILMKWLEKKNLIVNQVNDEISPEEDGSATVEEEEIPQSQTDETSQQQNNMFMNPQMMFMNPVQFMANPQMTTQGNQNLQQGQNSFNPQMMWTPQMFQQMMTQQMMTQQLINQQMMNQQTPSIPKVAKIPVPEWNLELSFEAWERNVHIWSNESMMTMGQKMTQILESLKKNQERPSLKAWVIQNMLQQKHLTGFTVEN